MNPDTNPHFIQPDGYAISVSARPQYLPDQSEPEAERYVFAYTITVHNGGRKPAQLLSRHWIITDANGEVTEVRGAGVVGEQPELAPGQSYTYTSGAVLTTPLGSMHGSYQMLGENGVSFEAEIPAFTLTLPQLLH